MLLEIESDEHFENPTDEEITLALQSLGGHGGNFAILSHDDLTYMQTSGNSKVGFVVEYQEGSMDRHYRTPSLNVPIAEVTEAFCLYAKNDKRWKDLFEWEKEDFATVDDFPTWLVTFALLALAAAFLLFR